MKNCPFCKEPIVSDEVDEKIKQEYSQTKNTDIGPDKSLRWS